MKSPRPIKIFLLPLLFFAAQKVGAQLAPPDDFFNRGAQLYISNNIPAAKEQVENGLKFYPDDEKLKKLEALLNQQQQQQTQNQQSQSQQNQAQNQNSSQQQKNQQPQNQQNQSPQNQQQSQSQSVKNQEQKNAAEKAGGQTNENQNGGSPVAAAQMTPEEAKRLLDSQKGDEQFLQLKPQGKPDDAPRKIKDW